MERPPILQGSAQQQLAALRDYLFRLAGSLENVQSAPATDGNYSARTINNRRQGYKPGSGSGQGGEKDMSTEIERVRQNARELKALIIKTAEGIQDRIDHIELTRFFVKYADDFTGAYPPSMYSSPKESTVFMGVCSAEGETAPSDPAVYSWSLIKGTDGQDGKSVAVQSATKTGGTTTVVLIDSDGVQTTLTIDDGEDGGEGQPGKNGYVHTAWANSADGQTDFSTSVSAGKKYLGVYTDNTAADSPNYGDYSWSLIKGADGIPGTPGPNGLTPYLHIKYSDDGETFTGHDGEDMGAWIGMYSDYTEADSAVFARYTWHRFADDTELNSRIDDLEIGVYEEMDSREEEYRGYFLAQSEFGDFEENLDLRIETNARNVVESYGYSSAIRAAQDSVNAVQDYYTQISGEIRRGFLDDPDQPGELVFGIAVSSDLRFTGTVRTRDGYEYHELESRQTFGLYTATGWQFWIDGHKAGWFDSHDGMLHVANVYIEDNLRFGDSWRMRQTDRDELEIMYVGV